MSTDQSGHSGRSLLRPGPTPGPAAGRVSHSPGPGSDPIPAPGPARPAQRSDDSAGPWQCAQPPGKCDPHDPTRSSLAGESTARLRVTAARNVCHTVIGSDRTVIAARRGRPGTIIVNAHTNSVGPYRAARFRGSDSKSPFGMNKFIEFAGDERPFTSCSSSSAKENERG
eukprot:765448-Hanusia_phi.AAC.5